MPIQKEKALENLSAEAANNKATIEYLAMMSGIEIDSEEDEHGTQSEI